MRLDGMFSRRLLEGAIDVDDRQARRVCRVHLGQRNGCAVDADRFRRAEDLPPDQFSQLMSVQRRGAPEEQRRFTCRTRASQIWPALLPPSLTIMLMVLLRPGGAAARTSGYVRPIPWPNTARTSPANLSPGKQAHGRQNTTPLRYRLSA